MSFLTGWITNIIIFIILATIMDMLLPNTAMRKYAKMVIGLLLITVLLSPIFKLMSTDVDELIEAAMSMNAEETGNMENLIDSKKKEIQAVTSAYILEEVAVQLKTDGEEELINRYNYAFEQIEVSLKTLDNPVIPEDIAVISVILAEHADDAIETVRLVDIDTKKSLPNQSEQAEEVKQFLATQWGIDAEQIEVNFQFGSAN